MSKPLFPRIAVIDDALPADMADAILAHAIASQGEFAGTTVNDQKSPNSPQIRTSLRCSTGLGPIRQPLKAAMTDHFGKLCAMTGTAPFLLDSLETELVAHRDGHFYKAHIDTSTGSESGMGKSPRMLSAVLYLHRQPRRFSGGGIRFTPLVGEGEKVLEARHNRLVAFPSFAPHEVLTTHVPGNAFADARFSVNCWFRRDWAEK